jgi:uncharacterized membrane protein YidH (DUF202 family)
VNPKGRKTMKILLTIVSILLILVGVVWFLQGINILGGSSMTGQSQWAVIGSIAAVVGIGLLVFINRRKGTGR